jgi:3-methyladenine DNA glycosylase AlkD
MVDNHDFDILFQLRHELSQSADVHTKNTAQRFFKEQIKVHGIKTAIVSKISKKHFENIKNLTKSEIFKLCEKLFSSGYLEESFIACNWAYNLNEKFEKSDFYIFEKWIEKYVNNWATCDTLCNHTVGVFIEKYPVFTKDLMRWAKSKNRWMRRASAVSLIIPAKSGKFLNESFKIADILLMDQDDLVQKGYGWLLKEQSRKCQKQVFDYVIKNKSKMPRTALRYAIEKMSKELKEKAMAK